MRTAGSNAHAGAKLGNLHSFGAFCDVAIGIECSSREFISTCCCELPKDKQRRFVLRVDKGICTDHIGVSLSGRLVKMFCGAGM